MLRGNSERMVVIHSVVNFWRTIAQKFYQQLLQIGWLYLVTNLSSLNNFFCGMHVIVRLADTAAAVLFNWGKLYSETVNILPHALAQKSESGTND